MAAEHTPTSKERYTTAMRWLHGDGTANSIDQKRGERELQELAKDTSLPEPDLWQVCARARVPGYAVTLEEVRYLQESMDLEAQITLGICYETGKGVPQNPAEAVRFYTRAAEQGSAEAQYNLGVCYETGNGVPQNLAEAVRFYTPAAKQGSAGAQCNLGVCYANGNDVIFQNFAEAARLFTRAAEQGNAQAQCNLGICYATGKGVIQDLAKAVHFYTRAAERGSAQAQGYLGVCYITGKGVPENPAEAVRFYTRAAEQGDAEALFTLALCYEYGDGAPQNYAEAARLFTRAAKKELIDAEEWCEEFLARGIEASDPRNPIERLEIALRYFDPTEELTGPNSIKKRIMDWALEFKAPDGSNPFLQILQLRILEIQEQDPSRTFLQTQHQPWLSWILRRTPVSIPVFPNLSTTASECLQSTDGKSGLDNIPKDLLTLALEFAGIPSDDAQRLITRNRLRPSHARPSRPGEENKEEMVSQGTHRGIDPSPLNTHNQPDSKEGPFAKKANNKKGSCLVM